MSFRSLLVDVAALLGAVASAAAAGSRTPALVTDINPIHADAELGEAVRIVNRVFVVASTDCVGREPWVSAGTAVGKTLVRDFPGDEPWYPLEAAACNGELWFQGRDDARGYERWRSDGTPAGTRLARDAIRAGHCSAFPYEPTPMGGRLYFGAFGATGGYEPSPVSISDLLFANGFEAAP